MAEKIRIIGVPMDLGADRRGVDMGPSALRYADLNEKLQELGYDVEDLGDMDVICLLYTSPSPRDGLLSRMPSSA